MTSPLENITIYNPVGTAYGNFPVTDSAERSSALMGDDFVRLVFVSETRTIFDAFSFIVYEGKHFFLKETYRPTPKGTHYEYEMKFVSVGNMLAKHICMRHYVVSGETVEPEPEICVNTTLSGIMEIVMRAINNASGRLPKYAPNDTMSVYAIMLQSAQLSTSDLLDNQENRTFTYEGMKIAEVLSDIANGYQTEWWIEECQASGYITFKLHVCKCENTSVDPVVVSDSYIYTPKALKPYASRGLLSCEYAQEWSDIPQTILPYGSERNITRMRAMESLDDKDIYVSYGKRLRLNPNTIYEVKDGQTTKTIQTDSVGAVTNDGVVSGIETVEIYDDIYPQGHFAVTSVVQRDNGVFVLQGRLIKLDADGKPKKSSDHEYDMYTFAEMSTDGNYAILPITNKGYDESPYVMFETGLLAGRKFDINVHAAYVNSTRVLEFALVPEGDLDDPLMLPTNTFFPTAASSNYEGDMFAMFNIDMPVAYTNNAKNALAQAVYNKLKDYQSSRPDVKCAGDPEFFSAVPVGLGTRFSVYSELFGVVNYNNDQTIDTQNSTVFSSRVTAYSFPLSNPANVEFTLASGHVAGALASIENVISDRTDDIRGLQQRSVNISSRAWHDTSEMASLLESIIAEMMVVGVERYQFAFTFGIECINRDSVFEALQISAGYLQHTQKPWTEFDNGGKWESLSTVYLDTDEDSGELKAEKPYYLYAIVASDSDYVTKFVLVDGTETVVISGIERPKYYADDNYLLLGVLSSIFADEEQSTKYRVFNRSNGFTQIAGGTITTEQIQDATRSLIIDFQSNPPRIIARNGAEIIGDIKFSPSDTPVSQKIQNLGTAVGGLSMSVTNIQNQMANMATLAELQQVQDDLQNQIDGAVSSWFGHGKPYNDSSADEGFDFLTKYPATEWLVEESVSESDSEVPDILQRHIGDMYYDRDSGYGYRFIFDNDQGVNMYAWIRIQDSDVVEALQKADQALDVANSKVTIFRIQPTVPYKAGDMWQQDANGKILYSTQTRNSGSFVAGDWVSASAYAEAMALKEVGSENLIGERTFHIDNVSGNNDYYYKPMVGDLYPIDGAHNSPLNPDLLEPSTKYVFSFKQAEWIAGYSVTTFNAGLYWKDGNGVTQVDLKTFNIGDAQYDVFETPAVPSNGTRCAFIVYAGMQGSTKQRYIKLTDPMLQKGEKPSAFNPYMHHLVSAIEGTTEVSGGLVMTNVLMLKDENGDVKAGMSGLAGTLANPENVLLWGGGDYADAQHASQDPDYKKYQSNTPITTLLKKDGTGKIGCFRIDDETVLIDTGDNKLYLSTKTIAQLGISSQSTQSGTMATYTDSAHASPDTQSSSSKSQSNAVLLVKSFAVTAGGKYKITIPQVSISMDVNGVRNSTSDSVRAYGECSLKIRILNGSTILYESSVASISQSQSEVYLHDGGALADGKTPSASIASHSAEYTLSAGMLYIQIYGSYDLYATESGGTGSAELQFGTGTGVIKLVGTEKRCAIAKDGMAFIANSDCAFFVRNTGGDTLTFQIKGLPQTASSSYKPLVVDSNGYVRKYTGS